VSLDGSSSLLFFEMPAEVPVEDENVEELIKDEENQENVGRGKRKRGRPPTSFKPVKQRKSFSNASVIQNIQNEETEKKDQTVHKCGLCGITYKRRANWKMWNSSILDTYSPTIFSFPFEFSFCSSIYSIVRVNNNLYGTIG
jgi:hypothetical protein